MHPSCKGIKKELFLADTLAKYILNMRRRGWSRNYTPLMCLLYPVVFVNKCGTFMHPKAKFEHLSEWLDFFYYLQANTAFIAFRFWSTVKVHAHTAVRRLVALYSNKEQVIH